MRADPESVVNLMRDTEATRRRLMGEVLDAAEGDIALFYTMVRAGNGTVPASPLASHSEERVRDLLGPGGPCAIGQQLPNVTRPAPRETETFMSSTGLFGSWENFESRPFTQEVRSYIGVGDQVRLLVYHDRHFVGWIGAFRHWGAPLFGPAERRRLNLLVDRIRSGLVGAETLEQAHLPSAPAYLVVRPSGQVEHASPLAQPWLARPDFTRSLSAVISALDAGKDSERYALDQAEAHFNRLDGEEGVRYLVTVRPAERPSLSPVAALSPMQRRIAEYVAAGAQRNEVALALGISAETVRSHLRVVYERLGVANRLELSRSLNEEVH